MKRTRHKIFEFHLIKPITHNKERQFGQGRVEDRDDLFDQWWQKLPPELGRWLYPASMYKDADGGFRGTTL